MSPKIKTMRTIRRRARVKEKEAKRAAPKPKTAKPMRSRGRAIKKKSRM